MFVKINPKIFASGSNANVYLVSDVRPDVSPEESLNDKTWYKLDSGRNSTLDLKNTSVDRLVLKVGKISDNESLILRQFPRHANIIDQFALNEPRVDPANRFILLERVEYSCQDLFAILIKENLCLFVKEIATALAYLHKEFKTVFCDLSLSNTGRGYDSKFKLLDFGSVKPLGVKVKNPKDVNKLFCSPYFHTDDCITPCEMDDFYSLFYIFIRQSSIKLPWEYMTFVSGTDENRIDTVLALIKTEFAPKLPGNKLQYWPLDLDLEEFNFNKSRKN